MKKVFKPAAQIIITLIISLMLMEFVLYNTEIILPTFVITTAEEGDALEPHANVAYFAEGYAMNRVNDNGYWGPDYPEKKDPDKIRIALIGDSYVEALQVQPEHHFGIVLKNKLSELTGKEVEVLNFGRSGLSFREMYTSYEVRVKKYSPDFSLFFVQDQDFMRAGPYGGPQVYLNDNNQLALTNFGESDLYRDRKKWEKIKKYSSYSLFRNVGKMIQTGQSDEILLDKFDFIKTKDELAENKDSVMYKVEDTFFPLNKAIYKKLQQYEKTLNTKNITIAIESMPEPYVKLINEYGSLIDMQPHLEAYKSNTGIDPTYWKVTNTYGHWNYKGHEFVGGYLAGMIDKLIQVEEKDNPSKFTSAQSKAAN